MGSEGYWYHHHGDDNGCREPKTFSPRPVKLRAVHIMQLLLQFLTTAPLHQMKIIMMIVMVDCTIVMVCFYKIFPSSSSGWWVRGGSGVWRKGIDSVWSSTQLNLPPQWSVAIIDNADGDGDGDDDHVPTGNGVSPLVPAQNWEAPAFNKRMENCHHNHHHSHHYNHDQMENYTRRQCPTSLDPTRWSTRSLYGPSSTTQKY